MRSNGRDRRHGTLSSADLLARERRHPADWVVRGRLPSGGTSILVGEPGVGKSTLAGELALAVSRGAPWLGFGTSPGPVLYVSVGGRLDEIRGSFAALGLSPADEVRFLPVAPGAAALERVRELAGSLRPALVIVDPLPALLEAEELNDERVSPLDRILHCGQASGAHLLLVHTLPKGRERELSAILASTVRTIDTVLVLKRDGDRRLLYSVQRKGADIRRPIRIPARESLGDPSETSSCTRRRRDVHREILAYLRRTSRLVTRDEIRDYVDIDPDEIDSTLERLRRTGEILRVGERGTTPRYTGCDRIEGEGDWLRRVRPWALIPSGL